MFSASIVQPPALKPGARIALIAPSSCFPGNAFETGVAWLRAQGFSPWWQNDIFARRHYLAGPPERRIREFTLALADPKTTALWSARGGYGTMQILPHLDLSPLRRTPRIIIGSSDLTPLLNYITETQQIITFHGPMVSGLEKTHPASLERLLQTLGAPDDAPPDLRAEEGDVIFPGRAQGRLCGGNLTMIAATLGTPFALKTQGRILCLEEVGERPYRIDRLFEQLSLAGLLHDAAGIALGEFTDCTEADGRGRPIEDIMHQHLSGLRIPVLTGFSFGHGRKNDVLPLGAPAELDTGRKRIHFPGPVVASPASVRPRS